MSTVAIEAVEDTYVRLGAKVDFGILYDGVRAMKPKCVDCKTPLQESVTGVRIRLSDQGTPQKLCRACAVSEIGEQLVKDMPR